MGGFLSGRAVLARNRTHPGEVGASTGRLICPLREVSNEDQVKGKKTGNGGDDDRAGLELGLNWTELRFRVTREPGSGDMTFISTLDSSRLQVLIFQSD